MTEFKKKPIVLAIADNEIKNVKDKVSVSEKIPETLKPRKGFVQIIDKKTGEYLVKDKPCEFGGTGKNNLIVWQGREIIPQILFDKNRVADSGEKDLRVRWLSIGSGGADAVTPLVPIAPSTDNTQLVNEAIIDSTNPLYTDGGRKKPFDSITFEQDTENENRYLIAKVTTTILYQDAIGVDLNEMALWLSNTNDPLEASVFKMLARVTTSTIRIDADRELIVLWYIYF
jgi:hypothetical protein